MRSGVPPSERIAGPRERRWPAVLTLLVTIAMSVFLPERLVLGPSWLVPAVEGLLLIAIVAAISGSTGRCTTFLRALSVALVFALTAAAGWSAIRLIIELLDGAQRWSNARALLVAGALVWTYTNVAFAFVYWEMDSGGVDKRTREPRQYPDLAFPEYMSPKLAPPGWRPDFIDYLYLGFTNATAFSPTDVMPMRIWAKVAMALQASISIAILTLVVANAVNLLGQ